MKLEEIRKLLDDALNAVTDTQCDWAAMEQFQDRCYQIVPALLEIAEAAAAVDSNTSALHYSQWGIKVQEALKKLEQL